MEAKKKIPKKKKKKNIQRSMAMATSVKPLPRKPLESTVAGGLSGPAGAGEDRGGGGGLSGPAPGVAFASLLRMEIEAWLGRGQLGLPQPFRSGFVGSGAGRPLR